MALCAVTDETQRLSELSQQASLTPIQVLSVGRVVHGSRIRSTEAVRGAERRRSSSPCVSMLSTALTHREEKKRGRRGGGGKGEGEGEDKARDEGKRKGMERGGRREGDGDGEREWRFLWFGHIPFASNPPVSGE